MDLMDIKLKQLEIAEQLSNAEFHDRVVGGGSGPATNDKLPRKRLSNLQKGDCPCTYYHWFPCYDCCYGERE